MRIVDFSLLVLRSISLSIASWFPSETIHQVFQKPTMLSPIMHPNDTLVSYKADSLEFPSLYCVDEDHYFKSWHLSIYLYIRMSFSQISYCRSASFFLFQMIESNSDFTNNRTQLKQIQMPSPRSSPNREPFPRSPLPPVASP